MDFSQSQILKNKIKREKGVYKLLRENFDSDFKRVPNIIEKLEDICKITSEHIEERK